MPTPTNFSAAERAIHRVRVNAKWHLDTQGAAPELARDALELAAALEIAYAALWGIVTDDIFFDGLDRGVDADVVQDNLLRCQSALAAIDAALGEAGE